MTVDKLTVDKMTVDKLTCYRAHYSCATSVAMVIRVRILVTTKINFLDEKTKINGKEAGNRPSRLRLGCFVIGNFFSCSDASDSYLARTKRSAVLILQTYLAHLFFL